MKMTSKNMCKKRGGVLICAVSFLLCLTLTAICFDSNPLAAKADGADLRANLFTSSTAVTVDTSGVTIAEGGTGKINGIFTGGSAFKFSFGKVETGKLGNFRLTVADAENPAQSFTVVYHQQQYSTNIFVQYGNERRTSRAWQESNNYGWTNAKQYSDSYLQSAKFDGASVGELYIEKNNDIWQVKAKRQNSSNVVAAFDGTDALVTDKSWGLPTLHFANGYTVSYSSAAWSDEGNNYVGADVTWKEIAGTSLTSAVATAPKFYSDYKATVVDTENLFTATTAVTADANGVTVAAGGTGKINGIFTGNSSFKFSVPKTDGSANNYLEISVADAETPSKSFKVVYYKSNGYYTNVSLIYNDVMYSTKYDDDNTWYNAFTSGETNISYGIGYGESFRDDAGGTLSFVWNGDILTVSSTGSNGTMRKVASFDGTETFVSGTSWGLPKMTFSNGYTVSFASAEWNTNNYAFKGADVTWKEINGAAFAGKDVAIPQFYKNKDVMPLFSVPEYDPNVFAGKEVTIPAVQVKAGLEGTLAAAHSVAVKSAPSGSSIAANSTITDGKFTPDVPGEYVLKYTGLKNPDSQVAEYNTREITLTASARTPVIMLSQDITLTALSGATITIPSAVASIESAQYSVYVSVEFDAADVSPVLRETLATENKSVEFSQAGTYIVKYVTKEDSPAVKNAEKIYEIIVSQAPPVITLAKEVAPVGITGKTGIIPAATATISGEPCNVTVSVIFEEAVWKDFENVSAEQELKVTFAKAGTYIVVYYAEALGKETETTFTVEVKDDKTKPVLTIGTFESNRVAVGAEIVIPSASATDDADGNVTVTVTVWFGTEEVAVADGEFTADKEGTYRIVFSASDASGNSSEEEVLIEAVSSVVENPDKGCGCKGSLSAGSVALAAIALFAAFITVLVKRKQGVK